MESQLFTACSDGKVEEVIKLLQNSQININWQDFGLRRTSFYIACQNGHLEIVKLLLNDTRVDVNKGNKNEATPFYAACGQGHIDIVKLLLNDKRVGVNNVTRFDLTPFYIACLNRHIDIVKLLLESERIVISKENHEGETAFSRACEEGYIEIVKLLLKDERINVNQVRNNGWTPLFVACKNGHIEIGKLLLNEKGIDINKADNNDQTPFYIACQNGHLEIIGKTGLDWAKEKGKTDIVKLIESFQKRIEDEKRILEEEEEKRKEAKRKEEEMKFEEEKKKLEEERKKFEEEKRKEEESKKSSYEIDHNGKLYKLKTTAKTLQELENELKSKLKLQQNDELILQFNENGKMYVLDDIEDLKEGMTIKVSISTQLQSDSSFSSSSSSLSISNLTITNSTNVNNECWWNTKPNEKTKWEEKGFQDTRYLRYLLRDKKQNVVDNGNEYLKKLEILMAFFGGDMNQINKAYVLFNEKLFDSFQHHRSSLFNQQRASPTIFKKDDWKNGNDLGQKLKFHDHYSKMAEGFDWNHSKFLHAIPMIHGTNEIALKEICQTGLAATGETDPGYYGQGMYFSSSLFYSSRYAKDSPDGKPFVICMITPGNVYPVTEVPYLEGPIRIENPEGFIRKPCKLGYQSHYTLVDKRKHVDAYPITGKIDENVTNELVVFEKAQVVPLFAIYFK